MYQCLFSEHLDGNAILTSDTGNWRTAQSCVTIERADKISMASIVKKEKDSNNGINIAVCKM